MQMVAEKVVMNRISTPRKNAYELAAATSGRQIWTDRKGTWSFEGLDRIRAHQGEFRYETRVKFTPDPQASLKQIGYSYGYVFYEGSMSLERWKRQLKREIHYTPSVDVLKGMYTYLQMLCAAWEEVDCYYAIQDKNNASRCIETCLKRAMDRYRAGNEEPVLYRSESNYDRFVSVKDKEILDESYKIVNGHAFMEPEDGIHGGHTHEFRKRLNAAIDEEKRRAEQQEKLERKEWQEGLMETDPIFRRLAAQALEASKKRGYGHRALEKELTYRLFGYGRTLDEYREGYKQLLPLMRTYKLETYEAWRLVDLAQVYLQNGGMLPPVKANYERGEGFYYGDVVKWGEKTVEVVRVGRRYVYLSNGSRITIHQAIAV